MTPAVTLSGVSKTFGTTTALESIDLEMGSGSFTAVVGASGSGKSTLLRLVGDLDRPTTGSIVVGGRRPEEVRQDKQVGWMSQAPALLPWRTVIENVRLAQAINPVGGRHLPDPDELLAMVGLTPFASAHPPQLSGGMQQRASLARTLAIGAPLWLMDEPFAALDELTREALTDDLLRIWQRLGPTVVWVTHHLPEAVKLADRVVLLTPGPGRVADVVDVDLARPREETSAAFQDVVRRCREVLRGLGTARVEVV